MTPATVDGERARCYLCGAEHLEIIRRRLRHDVVRNVLRCARCAIVYLEPKDVPLKEYYAADYRARHSPVLGRAVPPKEMFEIYRPFQESRVAALRHLLVPTARVLEIGCSAGQFLDAIKDQVAACVGNEFNEDEAAFVRTQLGIEVYGDPLEQTPLEPASFDLIAAFQVLEHVDAPLAFLASVRRYLRPGGTLCIEVPNLHDALLTVYRNDAYADFWFREPHVFYYTPETLRRVLARAGLTGTITTTQHYNVLNHLHWIGTGRPQANATIGMSSPVLVSAAEPHDEAVREDFNRWIEKVDAEYRALVTRHGRGESILFIGGAS